MKRVTKPPRPPAFVDATPEISDFIQGLDPVSYEWKIIDKARKALWENLFVGDQVENYKIPKYYHRKLRIHNLYHLDIDSQSHIMYTINTDQRGMGVSVIEIFLDHKSYDRRMGYG